jgi:hypothetical protein
MFVNPPEVNMAWPEVLGGGYHYLMLTVGGQIFRESEGPSIFTSASGKYMRITPDR